MNWTDQPATENEGGSLDRLDAGHTHAPVPHEITVGRTTVFSEKTGRSFDVFTMALGDEHIQLIPVRNWTQLDTYKWCARGRLPASPAGLEITPEHVKVAGETVVITDPEGCAKLERILNEWLDLEKKTLEIARARAHAKPVQSAVAQAEQPPAPMRFHVEVDKEQQVHITCVQGKEVLALIGMTQAGFNSLFSQGLMRKPHKLQVGALHDWVELDGTLYSFEKGNNDGPALEQALNDSYLPSTSFGQGKEIVVFANAASSTGFDIQFPVIVAGSRDHHKRPLNEESLELLQDPDRCGLLHREIVIKVARPHLIFKQKTPDGGEQYLRKCRENVVIVPTEEGGRKEFDLSQPVNYLHISPVEFTAIFNHPAINKHARMGPESPPAAPVPAVVPPRVAAPPKASEIPAQPLSQATGPVSTAPATAAAPPKAGEATHPVPADSPARYLAPPKTGTSPLPTPEPAPQAPARPVQEQKPSHNAWLRQVLSEPGLGHDWLVFLAYAKLVEVLGESLESHLGQSACWVIPLSEIEEIEDRDFRGVFLTEKHGFGYLNQGHLARFNRGVAILGTRESALEGIGVDLVALGLDSEQRVVFLVRDDYRSKFGVPDQAITEEQRILRQKGALVLSLYEALHSPDIIEVVWTVPAKQGNPDDPQVAEATRPEQSGDPIPATQAT